MHICHLEGQAESLCQHETSQSYLGKKPTKVFEIHKHRDFGLFTDSRKKLGLQDNFPKVLTSLHPLFSSRGFPQHICLCLFPPKNLICQCM